MSNIFLGYPPPSIREWIEKNYVKEEIVDDLNTPLTFTAEEPNAVVKMISYNGPEVVLETSVDGGVSWQPFYVDETEITLANVGDKVMFRSSIYRQRMAIATSMNYFQLTNKIAASGNIMFLVDRDGELRDLTDFDDGGLGFVFQSCKTLTRAPALPATTLSQGCYNNLFGGCRSLTNAYFPNLDSETVINEVVRNQWAFDYAANNIEAQCSDKTIIINGN